MNFSKGKSKVQNQSTKVATQELYFLEVLISSPPGPAAKRSSLRPNLRSRAALALVRRASNWSMRVFSRVLSALVLWIASIRTRLFLKTLPLTFRYISWYMCLSIFLPSRYFLRSRRRTRRRRIHSTFVGRRASRVPLRLPRPACLPLRLASKALRVRAREWILVGLRITNPSFTNFRMFCRELAMEISLTSLGSNQILRSPHLRTDAASRFCSLRATIFN
mmetsp:Transcript_11941/g.16184  ORF Transcript_11941/g.16184 Transcript_11941/m.16184 type:complete len:221 (-) Transcript_11941:60-722(-)